MNKNNIKVFVRFRPSKKKESHLEFFNDDKKRFIIHRDFERRTFQFDHVFPIKSKKNNKSIIHSIVSEDILE